MKFKPLALLIALSLSACGGGADKLPAIHASVVAAADGMPPVATADSNQFLMSAYQDGLAEISLSQMAQTKSSNARVQRFAQRMVADHSRYNNYLAQLAQTKAVALPTAPTAEQQAEAARLAALDPAAFDAAYMAGNVLMHDHDVATTMRQARNGTDTDVRHAANIALPVLELHYAAAKEINNLITPTAFVTAAYLDGLFEIQLSQLALQKTTTAQVAQFAQTMVTDHTQANAQLAALAQAKNVALPTALTESQSASLEDHALFTTTDFDKAFMDKNVIAHALSVRQARQQSEQGPDPEIKALAAQLLPTLMAHRDSALQIDTGIDGSFLFREAQDANALLRLAQLAQAQGTDPQMLAFVQQLTPGVAGTGTRRMQNAQQRNLALPVEVSPTELLAFAALSDATGNQFDQQVMGYLVQTLNGAIERATAQSQDTSDPGLSGYADRGLTAMNAQLTQAQQLLQQLGGSASGY